MRTLALLLLLTNLVFLAWQQQFLPWLPWQPELLQPEPVPPYHSTLPKLVLLSEREAATQVQPQVVASVEKTQAVNEPPMKGEHQVKVEEKPPVPPPAPISPEPVSQPLPASETKETKSHAPPPDIPAPTTEKTAAPTEPVLAQPQTESVNFQKLAMRLISQGKVNPQPVQVSPVVEMPKVAEVVKSQTHTIETPPTKTESTQKVAQQPPPVHEVKPVPLLPAAIDTVEKDKTLSVPPTKTNKTEVVCYQVGHFLQLGEAQAASSWFKKKQVVATPQKSDARLATTTWLYLPAARSLQSAQTTQQRLKQLGIVDTVVINNPNNYIVSLGVYRDKASISQRLQELHNKGFDNVKTEERYATETKYWLNVKIVANATTLLSQFQKAFKGLQAKTTTCDDLH